MDSAEVKDRLGLPPAYDDRLHMLEAAPAVEVPPLRDADAARLFPLLGVPPEDAAALLELQPGAGVDPAWTWLLQHSTGALLAHLGSPEPSPPWPDLPAHLGARGRLFASWVCLGALPSVRRWHEERDVPAEVSWATFADLGVQLALHRRVRGTAGVRSPWWLQPHFRGALFRLGRLQFARHRAPFGPTPPVDATGILEQGRLVLDAHVPGGGPLDVAACDASFSAAAGFFARHFPEDRARVVTCTSWLLDEELARHLPAESNIIRFQRRFTLLPGPGENGDKDILFFVFRREEAAAADLPRRTRLERALADRLAAGGHWQVRRGWCELGEAAAG